MANIPMRYEKINIDLASSDSDRQISDPNAMFNESKRMTASDLGSGHSAYDL